MIPAGLSQQRTASASASDDLLVSRSGSFCTGLQGTPSPRMRAKATFEGRRSWRTRSLLICITFPCHYQKFVIRFARQGFVSESCLKLILDLPPKLGSCQLIIDCAAQLG